MSLHVLSSGNLIISVNCNVLHVDVQSGNIEKVQITHQGTENAKEVKVENFKIQNSAVSSDDRHLAVSSNQKELHLYEIDLENEFTLRLLWTKPLQRTSHKLRFSSNALLIADKTGDCFISKLDSNGEIDRICGHISMVMDLLLAEDNRFLISCDRDEKIRVTNLPDSNNIEAYCVGHTEYVSQIEILPTNPSILCSLSGDQSLRFWDFTKGREIFKIPLPAPGVMMSSWPKNSKASLFAISMYKANVIQVYEIVENECGYVKLTGAKQIEVTKAKTLAIQALNNDIFTLSQDEKNKISLEMHKFNKDSRLYDLISLEKINETLQDETPSIDGDGENDEVSTWFKKKFDNLSEYHERKRKRVEMINEKKSK